MLKIKNIKLDNPLVLAPMAGVTNLPFRILCKNYGASLVFTEMISANAIVNGNDATMQLAKTGKTEKPVGIQLFGNDPEIILKAAEIVEKNFDIIDLNCGCPVDKITECGYGADLLKNPKKIHEIIALLSQNIKKPISAKIRIEKDLKTTIKIAKKIENAGASFLTLHARTKKQGYSGKADWDAIKKVKKAISIPLIGNGDINNESDVKQMLDETSCDAVMIGRKAMGNPYFFKQCDYFLKTGEKLPDQTAKERIKDFFDYLKLVEKFKISDRTLKQQANYFTLGLPGSRELRGKLNRLNEKDKIIEMIGRLR